MRPLIKGDSLEEARKMAAELIIENLRLKIQLEDSYARILMLQSLLKSMVNAKYGRVADGAE